MTKSIPKAVKNVGRATLTEVSERAGVSRSTASLVLRGSSRISTVTQERVKQAMRDLGYVYNRQAASMRESRSMTIGLVATDIRNPYFAELTMSLADSLHEAGYTLLTGYSRDRLDRQDEQVQVMIQRQVDGLLLLPAIGSEGSMVGPSALASGTPLVQLARYFSDEFDYVGPDNLVASVLLAQHISSLGRGTATLIGGPLASSARIERMSGLESGFNGSPVLFDTARSIPTENNADDGARGLSELLDAGFLPDIVIAYSDAVALGVYAELRRRNLEPGRDIAVASFDDIPFAALQVPQLTSVATHPEQVGHRAAELLLSRVLDPGRAPQRVLIGPTLKARASTALWRPRP